MTRFPKEPTMSRRGCRKLGLIRPTDRPRMRDWLMEKLDGCHLPGMEWVDRKQKVFRIKWCHGSRHGYCYNDSLVFEAWAKHTGRYDEDNKEPKRWKANFRCAIKSLNDIQEMNNSVTKGQNAFRVFQILEASMPKKRAATSSVVRSRPAKQRISETADVDVSPSTSHADSGICDDDEVSDAETDFRMSTSKQTGWTLIQDVESVSRLPLGRHTGSCDQEPTAGTSYGSAKSIRELTFTLPLFEKICPDLTKIGHFPPIPAECGQYSEDFPDVAEEVVLETTPDDVIQFIPQPDDVTQTVFIETSTGTENIVQYTVLNNFSP
ncbi:interferon regulatory factor 1-like isoform X3 [Mya arenaria]|uniref:interferon regulatory factor 1-like isoform X3 n=1 Tax=Mya arenaria TaxID=6604 RepID=UPI0022E71BC1|nr:interferon regulatory factor 1-like isoform X3 [Mya arenaria]